MTTQLKTMMTWRTARGSRTRLLTSHLDPGGWRAAVAGNSMTIGIASGNTRSGGLTAAETSTLGAGGCNSSRTMRSIFSQMLTGQIRRIATCSDSVAGDAGGYLLTWQLEKERRRTSWAGMVVTILPVFVMCLASPVAKAKMKDAEVSELNSPEGSASIMNMDDKKILSQAPAAEVKSNSHTARWRVFTDVGRNMFAQGRLEEAEKYFQKALDESKQGFGEDDPHVASSCNNLAEIYRVRRDYQRAEPLYLEAVARLEATMGKDNQSVGLALHNLGGFYLLTKNLQKSKESYEKALKVKEESFGKKHPEYALTLFHLGEVIRLMGNVKEAEKLIRESLSLLEEAGGGYSPAAIRRMSRLADLLVQSRQLHEAELVHRRILHIVELSKGSEGVEAANAMENLGGSLHLRRKLEEASELLQRCLQIRQMVLGSNHMQVGSTLFKLGIVTKEQGDAIIMANSKLPDELEKAKDLYNYSVVLLHRAIRIAEQNWDQALTALKAAEAAAKSAVQKDGSVKMAIPTLIPRFMAVLQSLNAVGLLKIQLAQLPHLTQDLKRRAETEAEAAFRRALHSLPEEAVLKHALAFAGMRKEILVSIQSLCDVIRRKKEEGRGHQDQLEQEIQQLEQQAAKFQKTAIQKSSQ